jgi:hypothetical protein
MKLCLPRWFTISLAHTVILTLFVSQMTYAQAPIVSRSELMQAMVNAAKSRKENLDQVQEFLATDLGRKAVVLTKVDPARLQKMVATLSSDELAKLATQTRGIQNDFAAGALNNQEITYILIALATAVVVLILVK